MSLIDSEVNDEKEIDELSKEYKVWTKTFILRSTVIKKKSAFKKCLLQLNVHVVIHYSNVVTEYETAFNCLIQYGLY